MMKNLFPQELQPFEAVVPVPAKRTPWDIQRALIGLAKRYGCGPSVKEVMGSVIHEELVRQEFEQATAGRVRP